MKEEWRKIKGFLEKYEASNLGRIRSLDSFVEYSDGRSVFKKGRVLTPTFDKRGYGRVCLRRSDNSKAKMLVHQLVAIAFLNHRPNGWGLVVDHKDENKCNNTLSNLRLITNRENVSRSKTGKTSNYTGVDWKKSDKRWRSAIRIGGKTIHLGNFKCEFSAHLAYQKALASL